jgi:hypothetical protein
MHAQQTQLKPLSTIELTPDEGTILKWMRNAAWEPQKDAREPIPYKAKVPEFFNGVRLYRLQAGAAPTGGGAMGPLDLFIKKIQYQGVISKQDLYPVVAQGSLRFLSLRKTDLENLGVRIGHPAGDEDDD